MLYVSPTEPLLNVLEIRWDKEGPSDAVFQFGANYVSREVELNAV
jgi:hypothetical protein